MRYRFMIGKRKREEYTQSTQVGNSRWGDMVLKGNIRESAIKWSINNEHITGNFYTPRKLKPNYKFNKWFLLSEDVMGIIDSFATNFLPLCAVIKSNIFPLYIDFRGVIVIPKEKPTWWCEEKPTMKNMNQVLFNFCYLSFLFLIHYSSTKFR